MMTFGFQVFAQDGAARTGAVATAHGTIATPAFMPVGTAATVKAMTPEAVRETGADIVLANTYHLMLRPGAERIAGLGGLHEFMHWQRPILTDSGGFQVYSLSGLRKMDEAGVTFKSHIDGTEMYLSPERSIEVQRLLDADITMAFDECTPFPAAEDVAAASMQLSMRWAERCRTAFVARPGYALFGIVQGGMYPDLRAESAARLLQLGFDGYAIGGLAVGEGQALTFATLDATVPHLPRDRPRYLMGVGRPADIVGAVQRGIDMFDCVMPTRSGRTGQLFTPRGTLNIRNARHGDDPRPVDAACRCPLCRHYSRGYLHHLFRAKEILGAMLATWHNLTHYQDLMANLRAAVAAGRLDNFAADFANTAATGDIDPLGNLPAPGSN
ncbi:MAG: tRNA guanosine(34) transglycosylase Tgt [Proteobacteria bacterium]|nr:tRNA guanosine(34) transglycosylase Tgt [Pseudomonadota bacterium]